MAIPKHKRRYTVTLTPANVDRFHAVSKKLGIPPSAMSSAIDDFLIDISNVLQVGIDEGEIGIKDLARLFGKQLDLINEEGKTDDEQKRPAITD